MACPRTHEYQSLRMTTGEILVCPIETNCSLLFLLISAKPGGLQLDVTLLNTINNLFFSGAMDSVLSSNTPRYLKFDTCSRGMR